MSPRTTPRKRATSRTGCGASGYFRKPVDDQALLDAIIWAAQRKIHLTNASTISTRLITTATRFFCNDTDNPPLAAPALLALLLAAPTHAHASIFQGETLDAIANGIAWVVLVIAPIIGIAVFWLVHILPEKIAHKKKHPQTHAIQCLCLLSLCFGGLLWPIAWLWAYTKPVLHKMAYGTDVDESLAHHDAEAKAEES